MAERVKGVRTLRNEAPDLDVGQLRNGVAGIDELISWLLARRDALVRAADDIESGRPPPALRQLALGNALVVLEEMVAAAVAGNAADSRERIAWLVRRRLRGVEERFPGPSPERHHARCAAFLPFASLVDVPDHNEIGRRFLGVYERARGEGPDAAAAAMVHRILGVPVDEQDRIKTEIYRAHPELRTVDSPPATFGRLEPSLPGERLATLDIFSRLRLAAEALNFPGNAPARITEAARMIWREELDRLGEEWLWRVRHPGE